MDKLAGGATRALAKASEAATAIREEERGSSELVTVIVLIVIILVVILVFRDQLTDIVSRIGNKVRSWISDN